LGSAELEDAVVVAVGALRVVVGGLEVFGDRAGLGFVGIGVLAGVVIATSGAVVQLVKVCCAADLLRWKRARDRALEGEAEAVDEADVAVLVFAAKSAFELCVFGSRGVASVLAFVFAEEHAGVGGWAEAL